MISRLYENQIGTFLTMLLIFIAAAAGEYYIFHDHILVQENNGLLQSFFSQLNALFTLSFCVKLTLIIL